MLDKLRRRRDKPEGAPPGTLVHTGELKTKEVEIDCHIYNQKLYKQKTDLTIEEVKDYYDQENSIWLEVTGLHQVEIIKGLGDLFDLHPLVLEDILDTSQRAKFEVYDDFVYLVLKTFNYNSASRSIAKEQLSIILGSNFIISFQEGNNDKFTLVKKRLAEGIGELKNAGVDYLAYRLVDLVVDSYFGVLEDLGEFILDLEDELVTDPDQELLSDVQQLKKEVILLQREIWPLKGLFYSVQLREDPRFSEETFIYLRDVDDHVADVLDKLQSFRDIITGMLDIYLSNINQKINQVMHILTVVSSIFIPLTFIAGLYGMNFKYMPELDFEYGYPITLGIMLVIGVSMFIYFKKNDWL